MHGRGNNKDKKDETLLKVRIQAGACQLHGCWGIKVGRRAGAIRSCLHPPELIQGGSMKTGGKTSVPKVSWPWGVFMFSLAFANTVLALLWFG